MRYRLSFVRRKLQYASLVAFVATLSLAAIAVSGIKTFRDHFKRYETLTALKSSVQQNRIGLLKLTVNLSQAPLKLKLDDELQAVETTESLKELAYALNTEKIKFSLAKQFDRSVEVFTTYLEALLDEANEEDAPSKNLQETVLTEKKSTPSVVNETSFLRKKINAPAVSSYFNLKKVVEHLDQQLISIEQKIVIKLNAVTDKLHLRKKVFWYALLSVSLFALVMLAWLATAFGHFFFLQRPRKER